MTAHGQFQLSIDNLIRRQKEAAGELEKALDDWEFADSQRQLADD